MFAGLFVVDFRGGPFDGCELASLSPPTKWCLAIPVTPDTPDTPFGRERRLAPGTSQPTSVAIYQLQSVDGGWVYRFIRADSPVEWKQV